MSFNKNVLDNLLIMQYYVWNAETESFEEQQLYDLQDTYFPNWDTESPALAKCYHEWTPYIGFTEKYDFCKKCDEKKQ